MARRVAALPRTRVPAAAGTAEPQLLEAAMRALPRGPRAARREPYCKAGGGSKGAGGSDRRLGRWRTSGGVCFLGLCRDQSVRLMVTARPDYV